MATLSAASPDPSRRLIQATALAVLIHALGLALLPKAFRSNPPQTLMSVESISSNQLDQMKRLLLKNQQSAVSEPVPEAATMSDRNSRVERETRARLTDVMPREEISASQEKPKPDLSRLGVSFAGQNKSDRDENRDAQKGLEQNLGDSTLPVGDRNLLNTQESIHFSFYSRMYERVGPLWQSLIRDVAAQVRVPAGDYTTQADIVLDREGNVIRVDILKRSGVPGFDRAVETTWKRLARFPNPPRALIRSDGYVHTGWTFTVQMSMSSEGKEVEFLPPERDY